LRNNPCGVPGTPPLVVDSIYTKPAYKNKQNNEVSGRFDVAMVNFQNTKESATIEGNILLAE